MLWESVIISAGYFSIEEIRQMKLDHRKAVLFYFDPRPDIYQQYKEAFKDNSNIYIIAEAVSYWMGISHLYLSDTSSSMKKIKDCLKIKVRTRSLTNIIEKIYEDYGLNSQKLLFLNCEGEEVPIILHTPLEELKRFDFMQIEFHPELYPEKDMQDCIDRLSPFFDYRKSYTSSTKHPVVKFRLKR